MALRITSLAAASLLAISGSAFAGTTAQGGPSFSSNASQFGNAPPASVIVQHAGLEWIWAAPCSEGAGSCGGPSHVFGFDTPTEAQWATWSSRSELMAAFTTPNGAPICGSPWMSQYWDHCDLNDAQNGHIFHAFANGICNPAYFDGCQAGTTESFLVRGVPEPETYALMVAGLGLVGFMARRRRA